MIPVRRSWTAGYDRKPSNLSVYSGWLLQLDIVYLSELSSGEFPLYSFFLVDLGSSFATHIVRLMSGLYKQGRIGHSSSTGQLKSQIREERRERRFAQGSCWVILKSTFKVLPGNLARMSCIFMSMEYMCMYMYVFTCIYAYVFVGPRLTLGVFLYWCQSYPLRHDLLLSSELTRMANLISQFALRIPVSASKTPN